MSLEEPKKTWELIGCFIPHLRLTCTKFLKVEIILYLLKFYCGIFSLKNDAQLYKPVKTVREIWFQQENSDIDYPTVFFFWLKKKN